jgi:hypothetical protein
MPIGVLAAACAVTVLVPFWSRHLLAYMDTVAFIRTWALVPGAIVWTLAGTCAAVCARRYLNGWRMLAPVVCAAAVALQIAAFTVPLTDKYRNRFDKDAEDTRFAAAYLRDHWKESGSLPTVYSDFAWAQTIWIEWNAKSYFELTQAIGVMFSRTTAEEVMRRAALVRSFEIGRFSRVDGPLAINVDLMVQRIFETDVSAPAPTSTELRRLCDDPGLDIAMLHGAALSDDAVGNGRIHIYDCRQMRSARNAHTKSDLLLNRTAS